jgi:hypothetical protein
MTLPNVDCQLPIEGPRNFNSAIGNRKVEGIVSMRTLLHDLRYGLRMLR